jgi:hypothetical protein
MPSRNQGGGVIEAWLRSDAPWTALNAHHTSDPAAKLGDNGVARQGDLWPAEEPMYPLRLEELELKNC